MKLFKSVRFAVVVILTTSFLISAFIILFNYSYNLSNNEVKGNLLDNTSVVSDPSAIDIVKQFPEKLEATITTINTK
jgi:hypothetical protein